MKTDQAKPKRRRLLVWLAAGLCLLVFAPIPLPLRVTAKDKELVVADAIETLRQDCRTLTGKGYARLYDMEFVKGKTRVYFRNNLGIPDTVFLEHGLQPAPQDRKFRGEDA